MHYFSTRDRNIQISSAGAIAMGLSREGGLFVPSVLPTLGRGALAEMRGMNYCQRAVYVMKRFLDDYSAGELADFTARAYGPAAFDSPDVAPLRALGDGVSMLELWHGPTCAFKDMALQLLPYLLTSAMKKYGGGKKVCILAATSGDTGKAALEGFSNVEGTKIIVFYPERGVSDIQKLQMTTQRGSNVGVFAVRGNFDDAQSAVKAIFSDAALRDELNGRGWILSSANSINWGRLLPQIVYYFSAWCDLAERGAIRDGEAVDFCVPTGNFGDILAGWYAKRMGLPIGRLICASNANNVLTDFIRTGVYNKNREFHTTISPSMDILISSNLERLLFDLTGDDRETAGYMRELAKTGRYEVSKRLSERIGREFWAGCADDDETRGAIGEVFRTEGVLIDPHTAVGYAVLKKYRAQTGESRPAVLVSTASPFKFCGSVLEALGVDTDAQGTALIGELERAASIAAPRPLRELERRAVRFTGSYDRSELTGIVRDFI